MILEGIVTVSGIGFIKKFDRSFCYQLIAEKFERVMLRIFLEW
jgi:hypothetical protein